MGSRTIKIEVNEQLYNWLARSPYAQFIGATPEQAATFILVTEAEKVIQSGKDRLFRSFEVWQLTNTERK